ncbi:MAG: type II toxin-antitoxin system VapC family toxin [Candidatus Sumerlaeota bacterium]|nr:type II toxin-antitoxin system VapC family toxin [Candidatus Sumerlaeota bacterium]
MNVLVAAHQKITRKWWENHRQRFNLFVSPLVEAEAKRGDKGAALRRLEAIGDIPSLEIIEDAYELADNLIAQGALPPESKDDAMHVALAAVHNMDYLLTWNCRHIDNAEAKPAIRAICATEDYVCPEICTPEELMGDDENG